jgi:predicted transcriptional regulator
MSEVRISDLVLTDEHSTIELDDTLVSAAEAIIALPRGVLIVLDDGKAKGVITSVQLLQAVANGNNMSESTAADIMNMDLMKVPLDGLLHELVPEMAERRPHAIVAVDTDGNFAGYFSPNDYREAIKRSSA